MRNKQVTEEKIAQELKGQRKNIHLVEGELTDYASLKVGSSCTNHTLYKYKLYNSLTSCTESSRGSYKDHQ